VIMHPYQPRNGEFPSKEYCGKHKRFKQTYFDNHNRRRILTTISAMTYDVEADDLQRSQVKVILVSTQISWAFSASSLQPTLRWI